MKKVMHTLCIVVVILALLMAIACCGGDEDERPDGDGAPEDGDLVDGDETDGDDPDGDEPLPDGDVTPDGDDQPADGDETDSDMIDGDGLDGDEADGDETDGDLESDEFRIRVPQENVLTCTDDDMGMEETFDHIDHLCAFEYESKEIQLYLQAEPTYCNGIWSATYEVSGAWIKIGGEVKSTEAAYDIGGNHRNDTISFKMGGNTFHIWHSSIGFGWRVCSPPDCLVVCDEGVECDNDGAFGLVGEGPGIAENGCLRASGSGPPPASVICVRVGYDGSVPDLHDPWSEKPDNQYYPLLPCEGEANYFR